MTTALAWTLAASLFAGFGLVCTTERAEAQFVCLGNATGTTVPPGTADGQSGNASGSGNNLACGPGANSSGAGGPAPGGAITGNTALGAGTLAIGDSSNNVAVGRGAQAIGDLSNNVATGQLANANGNGSSNISMGFEAYSVGGSSVNTAIGNLANASGDNSQNVANGFSANASGATSANIAMGTNATSAGDTSFNIAIGQGSSAAGSSSANVAIGLNAQAEGGTASTAVGNSAVATGTFASAFGNNASATFANSAAYGNGAVALRANQQVFGTVSNTYTTPGITSTASRAAQTGATQIVTSDASGNLATSTPAALGLASSADLAGINAQLNSLDGRTTKALNGVAMAFAMAGSPVLMPAEHFALTTNYGTFDGTSGLAFGAALRIGANTQAEGGIAYGANGGGVGGRVGLRMAW